jgi:hypothetical protein
MLVPAARPLAVLAAAAVTLVLAGCGRDDRASTGVGIKSDGVPAAPAPAPAAPAYPALATKNTTRVPGADAAETAAQIARIVFPGGSAGQRPAAIAFADAGDWRGALAGAVLMAPPLRAPLLYTSAGEIPDATAAAVDALRPTGAPRANGAQAIRLGASGAPGGLRTTALAGSDPFTLAKSIDDYRARVAGRFSGSVVVVSADEPAYAMPAAGWAAKSGDPVLFASRDRLPAPTREAIRAHGRPRIYLVGPASVISAGVEEQLSRLGTVTRIAGRDAPATAVEFARFSDGPFGWGVTDPGHGLVFTTPPRPAGAGPAGALSASGTYGPQLLTSSSGALPAVVRDYLRDIRPGYSSDPVRGVYNHAWIVGDTDAVPETVQAEIDGLLEITRVRTPSRQP